MNRLGMAINISHASDDAISQAIDISTAPVIATHHGLRAINDIPRNMPDGLLKKLAAKGVELYGVREDATQRGISPDEGIAEVKWIDRAEVADLFQRAERIFAW